MSSATLSNHRVALLGVGLIGGSLGLALKGRNPSVTVIGYDEPEVLDLAASRGAVDLRAESLPEAIREADLVVLCTPLAASLPLLGELAPHLRSGTVLTDTGSVKGPICAHARSTLPPDVEFIGGHPMAGSEKRGVEHADALLFENAVWALCPENPDSKGFKLVAAMVDSVGARALVMDAGEHDRAAARISHLPQLLATTLVNQIAGDETSVRLAAGGFRDMTRIASSSFGVWESILVANQGPILDELGRFARALEILRNRVASGDMTALGQDFHHAADLRASVPERSKGFLNPLSDVYVYTRDEPGALVRITGTLSEHGVNIKDIELLKIREGTGGTFRLGFSDDLQSAAAVQALQGAGFHAYQL